MVIDEDALPFTEMASPGFQRTEYPPAITDMDVLVPSPTDSTSEGADAWKEMVMPSSVTPCPASSSMHEMHNARADISRKVSFFIAAIIMVVKLLAQK